MTTVGASPTPTRLVCLSGNTTVTSEKPSSLFIIKKGNKIDVVHGAATNKKSKTVVPKLLKQVCLSLALGEPHL
jgi:hypothetical protein